MYTHVLYVWYSHCLLLVCFLGAHASFGAHALLVHGLNGGTGMFHANWPVKSTPCVPHRKR